MAIKGEFDGLDPLEFVSFETIRMSFSPSTGERVGCAVVEDNIEEGVEVDEPRFAVVEEMKEDRVERREDTNGFREVLMLLVKGVEEGK